MPQPPDFHALSRQIKHWGQELGFQQVGICNTDLAEAENYLNAWLAQDYHGEMSYMSRHGPKRSRPDELVTGTLRIISLRMNYWPSDDFAIDELLNTPDRAYIARYALGRDYHKLLRQRLQALAARIQTQIGSFGYRVFVDSAPVLERAIAEKSGLGWIGKNTNLIHEKAGSYFFLGEIYTDLPLPVDAPAKNHCGTCQACIDICPTRAIVAPYQLDARRCIAYLTIELEGPIPVEFRASLGNRVFGCDDCQAICPWNRFAAMTAELDFKPRHHLDCITLVELFRLSAEQFDHLSEGSTLRRLGYERFLRNLAVGLGNAAPDPKALHALHTRSNDPSPLVREHVAWAIEQYRA